MPKTQQTNTTEEQKNVGPDMSPSKLGGIQKPTITKTPATEQKEEEKKQLPVEYKECPFIILLDEAGNLCLAYKNGAPPCMRALAGTARSTQSDFDQKNPEAVSTAAKNAIEIFENETDAKGIIKIDENTPFTSKINCFEGKPNQERKELSDCRHSMIYFFIVLKDEQLQAVDKAIREKSDEKKKHQSLWKLCDKSKYEEWKKMGAKFAKVAKENRIAKFQSIQNPQETMDIHPEASFGNSFENSDNNNQ